MNKQTAITSKQTELEVMRAIAEETELTLSEVKSVFTSLETLVYRHMKKRGSGVFKIPKLGLKIRRVKKPPTKARMGRNPATGEPIEISAKPARQVVKVVILKALKESLN